MKSESLEINLFCLGDSADINTWSNLPYFFSKALIKRGVKINRINIFPYEEPGYNAYMHFLETWFLIQKRLFGINRVYDFFRDRVSCYFANKRIEREVTRFPNADFNIFLTFSLSSGRYSSTPVINVCDIAYEHYLEESGKKKGKRELRFIETEKQNLQMADIVCGLSEKCRQFLRTRYRLNNVLKLTPGINLGVEEPNDVEQLLSCKWGSKNIAFVGRGVQKRGIDILLEAFGLFNKEHGDRFTLHIVGASRAELATSSKNVKCHGYLSKGNPEDLSLYLEILRSATVFVMPMREGPFPGVIREALLHYTPVIMSNIWNEEQKIEHDYNGILVDRIEPTAFAEEMGSLLRDRQKWENIARNAHESVEQFSWERSVEELLERAMNRTALP
ncbi:MAG TPA: glycosyltransferase family 4 protein [Chthoniobacterales bacterium]